MNGTAPPSSSNSPLAELSAMLRASADVVERGEFHPVLMQTILHLNVYTSEYAEGMAASASSNNETSAAAGSEIPSSGESGAFRDVPDSAYPSAPNTSTSATAAAATGGYKSKMSNPFILKGMKKTLEKVTAFDKPKFVGEKNGVREEGPFDESRKVSTINNNTKNNDEIDGDNIASTSSTQQQRQHQRTANNNDLPSNNAVTDPSKPARPCFQRPINPSSNLIANGWIDQQRRSKMRVVWKDVLASLVEGRRPGEETTLWIQRQVIDYATMKVTGLEALHQIPMKWLEDVNYVDLYGDHQFTLKVYNIAEEFFFRTRDEQSAQSWVLTLRSARDASLEGNVRMAGAGEATEKRPTAKDMGLHDLEDWDTKDRQQGQGDETTMGNVGGGISPPQTSSDSRPSEINQQEQQQGNQAPTRLSIAELRAIAHGVGYNTRGMERQDLERIAAYVLNNGRQNPTPTTNAATTMAPTSSAGVDGTQQRMQQEAVMREAEQRAMSEMREREFAQKSQEEARRQKEIEEQAALERMRREREESEKHRVEELAEQQRRQQQDLDAQIAGNKRRQEEERHRKMAELQAQQQSQAATERIKREEDERRRVQQQRPSSNPTPPTSNGYPQHQQQWQQQQQQQQWQQQQQQQQHPGQQQRPNSNPSPPTAGGYPLNQQQWQQQQQWQNQHHQQPPRPPPSVGQPPSGGTGGNNAREMPGVPSKYAKQMDGKCDGDQVISASTLQIKRAILINWALQSPSFNALRPIDQLITTIHATMPPAYGVGPHEYFTRFTPIAKRDLIASPAMGNHPDETKLKKAVRKVKVFLHPDKLPRDFTSDQLFVARMLWDITSDSWEEFQKHKDELDWIRG